MKSKKILIVEDEEALLRILTNKLRKENFNVFEAQDGKKGLESALRNKPDLILLDLVMPSMDGLTMLKKLREDRWGNYVPVIILSNLSDEAQVNEASGRGVIDYIVKSNWGLEDIIKKAKDALKASR